MKIIKYIFYLLLGVSIIQIYSCSRSITKGKQPGEAIVYPSPPDTGRIQFLTAISKSTDITGNQSAFSKFILGESDPKPILKPYGIAFANGKLFVCDPGLGGLEIIDVTANAFHYFIPSGNGSLQLPLNCFVDEEGLLYVADGKLMKIVVFDQKGEYVTSFGEGENFKPTDVFVYGNRIWVTDMNNNKINVYERGTYDLQFAFPDADKKSESYLFMPTNLCVNNDKVYVSDIGGFNIKIYNLEGEYLSTIGSHGDRMGQFARPKGVAVDDESTLYAVDAGFENVQMFDKDGNLLMFFGGPYKGPGDMWLPAKVIITYDKPKYFEKYVDPAYNLKYLIFVTNQYGPDKISVYGAIEPIKWKN